MRQGLTQALVRVFELHVFPHDANAHFALRIFERLQHRQPAAQVARRRFQTQQAQNLSSSPSAASDIGTS